MLPKFLTESSFFVELAAIDAGLAADARARGCVWCGGTVHSARYPRKARGGPPEIQVWRRESLCCARCRRRTQPPSVLYLGRKVFLAPLIVMASRLAGTASAVGRAMGAHRRTVGRWRAWWQRIVPSTPFWRAAQGCLTEPLASADLPGALLLAFGVIDAPSTWMKCLRFMSPLSIVRPGPVM